MHCNRRDARHRQRKAAFASKETRARKGGGEETASLAPLCWSAAHRSLPFPLPPDRALDRQRKERKGGPDFLKEERSDSDKKVVQAQRVLAVSNSEMGARPIKARKKLCDGNATKVSGLDQSTL